MSESAVQQGSLVGQGWKFMCRYRVSCRMFVMIRIAETEPQGQQNNCNNNRCVNNDNHLSEI